MVYEQTGFLISLWHSICLFLYLKVSLPRFSPFLQYKMTFTWKFWYTDIFHANHIHKIYSLFVFSSCIHVSTPYFLQFDFLESIIFFEVGWPLGCYGRIALTELPMILETMQANSQYELLGIVNFVPGQAHYTCVCRRPDWSWCWIDDFSKSAIQIILTTR